MADMQAASTLLVIPAIGGTAATRIKYDGDGSRVAIWRRLDNGPWARLNLVGLALAENPALEPAEAARADRRGRFTTPALTAGQVLEYGLLPADGEFDPNMSGFSAGRFLAHLTILALLAGDNRTGWVTDGNIDVGGTYYRRQVFTADFPTAMRMGVGEEAPFRDPDSGIWTLPGPFETFDAPADMNHILTAVDLLPGHHYFATILLIDAQGRWSSFAEEFTTLKRRVTVRFEHLEVINDSDPSGTGEAALDFQVLRGQNHPGGLHLVASFHWEHGSISDKLQERHYTLTPFNFVSVQGFEPVTRSDREVVVRVWGTEFDGIFDPGGDEGAASRDVPLATPSGPGMESVLDQATLVAVTPSTDGSDFECRVTVRHSVEYAP